MAEFPNPVRLAQHIGWVAWRKIETPTVRALTWFERYVRGRYGTPGPRDN